MHAFSAIARFDSRLAETGTPVHGNSRIRHVDTIRLDAVHVDGTIRYPCA